MNFRIADTFTDSLARLTGHEHKAPDTFKPQIGRDWRDPDHNVNDQAWATLNSDTARAFENPKNGRISMKGINQLGDEVIKVFKVS